MLKGLLYLSDEILLFNDKSLQLVLKRSKQKNSNLGVTGYLYYTQGKFLQYIEGNEASVDALFSIIHEDDRHLIRRVITEPLQELRFPEWSMNCFNPNDENSDKIEGLLLELMGVIEQEEKEGGLCKTAFRLVQKLSDKALAK